MSESKNIKFEKGLEELEKTVRELESGELTLEEALKHYESGIKTSRALQTQLAEAEKKIEVLTKNMEGKMEAKQMRSKQ
jgi:exodeoxyribonuclease VII small subunit